MHDSVSCNDQNKLKQGHQTSTKLCTKCLSILLQTTDDVLENPRSKKQVKTKSYLIKVCREAM